MLHLQQVKTNANIVLFNRMNRVPVPILFQTRHRLPALLPKGWSIRCNSGFFPFEEYRLPRQDSHHRNKHPILMLSSLVKTQLPKSSI